MIEFADLKKARDELVRLKSSILNKPSTSAVVNACGKILLQLQCLDERGVIGNWSIFHNPFSVRIIYQGKILDSEQSASFSDALLGAVHRLLEYAEE